MRSDLLDVNGGNDDFYVVEGELGALGDDVAVQSDEGAAVVVESVAVAALLVGVEVDTTGLYAKGSARIYHGGQEGTHLERSFLDEVDPTRELSELVVRSTRVGKDLDAVQAHVDVWRARREELFAHLYADAGVARRDDCVAKRYRRLRGALALAPSLHACSPSTQLLQSFPRLPTSFAAAHERTYLPRNPPHNARQPKLLRLLLLDPRREPPQFAVVAIVREPHLGPNEEDRAVVEDDPAVVGDILVDDGPACAVVSAGPERERKKAHIPTSTRMS